MQIGDIEFSLPTRIRNAVRVIARWNSGLDLERSVIYCDEFVCAGRRSVDTMEFRNRQNSMHAPQVLHLAHDASGLCIEHNH
jgi:hypothetical protein